MKKTLTLVAGMLAGGALMALAVANPAGWSWLSRISARLVEEPQAETTPAAGAQRVKYWRAPMDPTFISDKPGKSPMGMDLVPVYEDEAEAPPPGTVRIDPTFRQNIGVKTEPVRRRDIALTIRTVGTLAHNDKQIAWVNTKYEGWIENVSVNYVGETVTRGQTLFEVYSPQLVTTEKEYLHALDYAARLDAASYPDIAARARALVDAARERLRYWDVSDAQIDALAASRSPRRTFPVASPVNGVVVAKMDQALDGMYVRPGMNIYKIADLSTIWVDVEIFENQVASMRVGQRAVVELPYQPGRTYTGYVRYLYPHFNEKTRTMTVSIELQNPDQTLRADMYANVTFDVPAAKKVLAVPDEAVIRTGTRDIVVVEHRPGLFRVVPVTLGVEGSGVWEVKQGLNEGDEVVVSAQFLIDSESNLREAIRKLDGDDAAADAPAGTE
jgi:RND family efflux transporter MFP subunit